PRAPDRLRNLLRTNVLCKIIPSAANISSHICMLNSGARARAGIRSGTPYCRCRLKGPATWRRLAQSIAAFASATGLFLLLALPFAAHAGERLTLNFNSDWRFLKADPPNAQHTQFNDSSWTTVSAPHTFNDTDTFDHWTVPGHVGETNQWTGRTWYRKS